jgi:hypothetical protein
LRNDDALGQDLLDLPRLQLNPIRQAFGLPAIPSDAIQTENGDAVFVTSLAAGPIARALTEAGGAITQGLGRLASAVGIGGRAATKATATAQDLLSRLTTTIKGLGDATKAETEGVEAAWGVGKYKHGGFMSTIEHINYRHAFNSGFADVSRFAEGTGVRDIKGYVETALRRGEVSQGGGTINYNLGRAIGTDKAGNVVSGIRVHVHNGIIRSAYPVAP